MTNTNPPSQAFSQPARGRLATWLHRWACLGLGGSALSLGALWSLPAQAETWFYVDGKGVLHYANERVDARYQRFSMTRMGAGDGPLHVDVSPKARAAARKYFPAGDPKATQRYFANSKAYKQHAKVIQAAAKKHGVDEDLLKAIARAESGFNTHAVSPKGAIGLMQVIPDTARRFGIDDDDKRSVEQKLTDPNINVPVSARYVRHLQGLFPGRTDLVLAAYNAGEGAVQRYGNKIPPYKETQNYVRTVMAHYGGLQPQVEGGHRSTLYSGGARIQRSPSNRQRVRMTMEASN